MSQKVIIITGASKGIGRAAALLLGKNHKMALTARNQGELEELAQEINQAGGEAIAMPGDVTSESDVERAVQATLAKFGRIDCLINNAGMGIFKRVDLLTAREFDQVYRVNMLGAFLYTKFVTPGLIQQKSGQIINVASVAGLNGFRTGSAYAASKFAMVGFTESIREDLKGHGIAVTAVCPGGVRTGFGGQEIAEQHLKSEYLLEPDDVARTLEYLVNESETANAKLIELKPRRRSQFRE